MEIVTTLATIPAILALVNLAKTWGVTGKWSALLAVILGLVLSLADYGFLTEDPLTRSGWYIAAATGLILGLSAAGLYDVAATISGPKEAEISYTVGEDGTSEPLYTITELKNLKAALGSLDPPKIE